MDADLLSTFLAVARTGGMRRAAATLHVSQPAVSARIQELEAQVGSPLFERVGRGVELTAAGKLLAAEAPDLLAAQAALLRRVQATDAAARATLHLATIDAASIYVLPEVYLAFRAAHPQVQLVVQVMDSGHVAAAVRASECDAGVLALPVRGDDLETCPIFEEEIVCVAPPNARPVGDAAIDLATLAAQPLVLYARGSTTRATLDAVLDARGIEPHVVMETASPEAMKRLVEVGVGWSLLPAPLVAAEVASGRLARVRLADARFVRRLGTVVRRGRPLPAAARRFLALVYAAHPPLENGAGSPVAGGPRRRRGSRGA